MFSFASEPEGSIDALLTRSTEIVWLRFDSSMILLPESACDATMGDHPIIYSERSDHAKMVRFIHTAWWWETTTFFIGLLLSSRLGYVDGG